VQGTQSSAVWNLDRLDQRALPLDTTFSYGVTGAGVTVYVVDTGIRSTHAEFGGRVRPGFTVFTDAYGTEDCHGHGTHVAGTVGGATYGVARDVALVPVRVMSCSGSGSVSSIIAGLDWIAAHRSGPTVVNMSLGGGASNALDTAVRNLIAGGVTVAVAAGNANADACSYSPARVGEAITTGATTSSDARASYSNYGACVNVFAPGSSVRAATNTSDTSSGTKSGTSMASPHAAGVAALLLQTAPSATPAQVFTMLRDAATSGRLTGLGAGSPNLLLYADPSLSSPTTPTPDPTPEPQPEPEPAPAPGPAPAPCSDCSLFTGTLAAGETAPWPALDGSGYVTTTTGLHQAWLRGPAGAELDLVLERWNGRRWLTVASAGTPGATEDLSYSGKAGTYRWVVVNVSGEGEYALYLKLP
jgi:aqualysin 1